LGKQRFLRVACQLHQQREPHHSLSLVEQLKFNEGFNAAQAASALQICPSIISRWAQKKEDLQASDGKKMSAAPGYRGLLKDVEAELLEFIEEWRQKGFDVNRYTLLRKAGTMIPEILNKTEGAAKICLSRFLAKNNTMASVSVCLISSTTFPWHHTYIGSHSSSVYSHNTSIPHGEDFNLLPSKIFQLLLQLTQLVSNTLLFQTFSLFVGIYS
jgi:hypothetical protein